MKIYYRDLYEWLNGEKDVGIYAADLEGRDVNNLEKINQGVLIIGNESKGVSNELLKLANVKITIPKKGKAESLNAAVAAGIILSRVI